MRSRKVFKSPGMKLVDPYGNEVVVEESPEPSVSSSMQSEDVPPQALPALRAMRPIKLVDAMGREVEDPETPVEGRPDEVQVKQEEEEYDGVHPMSRRESITRLREAINQMAEDFGESDE